jgi:hypothetical protein
MIIIIYKRRWEVPVASNSKEGRGQGEVDRRDEGLDAHSIQF